MHLSFRPSLPDPQSQNRDRGPRNIEDFWGAERSCATPAGLLSRVSQIRPKSERLNAQVIY